MEGTGRASLSLVLLGAILRHNREVLQELQFRIGISRFEREHTLVSSISLDQEYNLKADLPDTEEAVQAVKAVIDAVQGFLEVFMGQAEAERRVQEPVAKFFAEHSSEAARLGLGELFPGMAVAGQGSDRAEDVRHMEENEQVVNVFSALYHAFLSSARPEHLPLYTRRLESGLGKSAEARYAPEGTSLSLSADVSTREAVNALSKGLDSLVELTESYFGRRHALDETANVLAPVLARYGDVPEALGITDRILRGKFAKSLRFGVDPLDAALMGGLERGASTILLGNAGWARDAIASQFVREGLDMGGAVVVVSTSIPLPALIEACAGFGVRCEDALRSGRMAFVDYNRCNWSSVNDVDAEGNVFRCSSDLTNLGIAISMALKAVESSPSRRLVIEMLSPAMAIHGLETMLDFAMMLKARFERSGATALFLMSRSAHAERDARLIQGAFNSVIEITESDGECSVRVVSSTRPVFDPSRIATRLSDIGVVFAPPQGEPSLVPVEDRRNRVASGTQGLDLLCGAGIPSPGSFLVVGKPGSEREAVVSQFAREALARGDGLIAALSSRGPADFMADLSRHGGPRQGARMAIIDWHSCRERHVVGVERDGDVLAPSQDITNLGIALDMAVKRMPEGAPVAAVIDVATQIIRDHEPPVAMRFLLTMLGRLRAMGAVSLFTLDPGAHDAQARALLPEFFDGVLEVDAGASTIQVRFIRGAHFDPAPREILSAKGMVQVGQPSGRARAQARGAVAGADVEALRKELEMAVQDRQMLVKQMKDLEMKERELERDRSDFAKRLTEFNKEVARRGKQREHLERMEADTRAREAELEELRVVLKALDELLEHLPDDKVAAFSQSEKFKLYEKIMDKYLKEGGKW
ncbi:MAG: hypothetical protein HZB92_04995 [Euryarchaeota archaeon]|nr:hypothetical protein [Euryarchaeota archaeon]